MENKKGLVTDLKCTPCLNIAIYTYIVKAFIAEVSPMPQILPLDDGPVMTLDTAFMGDDFIILSMLIKWDYPCTNNPLKVSLAHACSKNKGTSSTNSVFTYDLDSDAGGKVVLVTGLLCNATCPYTAIISNEEAQYYRSFSSTFSTSPCPGTNMFMPGIDARILKYIYSSIVCNAV